MKKPTPEIELVAVEGGAFNRIRRSVPRHQSLYYVLDTVNMARLCRFFALKGRACYPQLALRSQVPGEQLFEFEGIIPTGYSTTPMKPFLGNFSFTIDGHPDHVELQHIHLFLEVLDCTVYVHVPDAGESARLNPFVRRKLTMPANPS